MQAQEKMKVHVVGRELKKSYTRVLWVQGVWWVIHREILKLRAAEKVAVSVRK